MKNTAPQRFTVPPFAELNSGSERGLLAEQRVADFLVGLGFQILHQRKKIFLGEVDIWAIDPNHVQRAFEVKTLTDVNYLDRRISMKDVRRLKTLYAFLLNRHPGLRYQVAFVDPKGSLIFLDLADL